MPGTETASTPPKVDAKVAAPAAPVFLGNEAISNGAPPPPETPPAPGPVAVLNHSNFAIIAIVPGVAPERTMFDRGNPGVSAGRTPGVPAEFWAAWLAAHEDSELVRSGLISAED